ncbi:MAG: hypothetical protein OXI87_00265 [Albidovulum sp.]|nr:hypothetical protein [Albidovulum sp.]
MTYQPIGIYAYPWDVLDEGPAAVLNAVERAGLNNLYLALWYHSGMFFLPHNPVRRVYFPTPGAMYFQPGSWHGEHALAPPVSDLCDDWTSLWRKLAAEAKRRDIRLSAWMPVLHNSGVGTAYPEISVENPWGDRISHTLCPSNESVTDLAAKVAGNVAELGIFERILLESVEYLPLRHDHHHEVIGVPLSVDTEFLASLCFCGACRNRAAHAGIDTDSVRRWARRTVDDAIGDGTREPMGWEEIEFGANGQFGDFLRVREEGVARASKRIVSSVRSKAPGIRVAALDFGPLYPLGANGRRWQNGVDLDAILPLFDELHPTFYFSDLETMAERISSYSALLGGEISLVPAIRAILPQTDSLESLVGQVELVAPIATGYTFYNYSFMQLGSLDWIKSAIRARPPELKGDK